MTKVNPITSRIGIFASSSIEIKTDIPEAPVNPVKVPVARPVAARIANNQKSISVPMGLVLAGVREINHHNAHYNNSRLRHLRKMVGK